jgi:peroxiredoxin
MHKIAVPLLAALVGCGRQNPPPPSPAPPSSAALPPTAASAEPTTTPSKEHDRGTATAAGEPAEVGRAAPPFTLTDLDGKEVQLGAFKGKTVVLEWFNPGCPFVRAAHTKRSLRTAAGTHTAKGVIWLAINSGAPGKQGYGVEANREAQARFGMKHPILMDPKGEVGRAYGATNTPHMFVIDPSGTLVYAGAIDNSPDGEGESPTGGKLVNHVDAALADLGAGRPVAVAKTKAYGCGVKYAR